VFAEAISVSRRSGYLLHIGSINSMEYSVWFRWESSCQRHRRVFFFVVELFWVFMDHDGSYSFLYISIKISSSEANRELWLIHSFSYLELRAEMETLSWWTWTVGHVVWSVLIFFYSWLLCLKKNVQLAGSYCETY
jgi:hypothetical protein